MGLHKIDSASAEIPSEKSSVGDEIPEKKPLDGLPPEETVKLREYKKAVSGLYGLILELHNEKAGKNSLEAAEKKSRAGENISRRQEFLTTSNNSKFKVEVGLNENGHRFMKVTNLKVEENKKEKITKLVDGNVREFVFFV